MMAKTPFKLRSGNVTPFKMMGSSPVKDTEPHTSGHTHTKEKLGGNIYDIQEDESIKVTREGIGTTTTPATVEKGKSYTEAGVDPAEAKAYWEANPEKRKEYEASLTTPGTTTTEDISTTETVEKPTREQRYRYEKPPVVAGGGAHTSLNIDGKRVRMSNEDYTNWLGAEGYTKDKRGNYRRRSTTGKGTPYNPDMVDISEKPDFDYSGVDYGDVGYRQFTNSKEQQESMEYNELLSKAKLQEKYKK